MNNKTKQDNVPQVKTVETAKIIAHFGYECRYKDSPYNWAIISIDMLAKEVLIQEINRDAECIWVSVADIEPAQSRIAELEASNSAYKKQITDLNSHLDDEMRVKDRVKLKVYRLDAKFKQSLSIMTELAKVFYTTSKTWSKEVKKAEQALKSKDVGNDNI